jgi:hypothetical protein
VPSWVLVVLVIVLLFAAALLRDHLRTSGVRRWSASRGFQYGPPPTSEEFAIISGLAKHFCRRSVGHVGAVLRKNEAGIDTVIAEYSERQPEGGAKGRTEWNTLVAMRIPGSRFDTLTVAPAPSQFGRSVTDAVSASGRAVRNGLGIEAADIVPFHPIGSGKWAIESNDPAVLAFWHSAPQAAAIDAWTHDGELASVDDYVLTSVRGVMNESRMDALLQQAAQARALFERAAAARCAVTGQ